MLTAKRPNFPKSPAICSLQICLWLKPLNSQIFHTKFPAELPAEQAQLLSHARETFAEAMAILQEALQLLEDGSTVLDSNLMEAGLSRMHEGELVFKDFAKDFEQAQGMTE